MKKNDAFATNGNCISFAITGWPILLLFPLKILIDRLTKCFN